MFSQHPTNTKRSSVMRSIYLFGLVVCTLNSLEDRIVSVEYFFLSLSLQHLPTIHCCINRIVQQFNNMCTTTLYQRVYFSCSWASGKKNFLDFISCTFPFDWITTCLHWSMCAEQTIFFLVSTWLKSTVNVWNLNTSLFTI